MENRRIRAEHGRQEIDRPKQTTWQHRFHIYAKENWYRDVWMIILTIVVVATVKTASNTSSEASQAAKQAKTSAKQAKLAVAKVQAERRFSVRLACDQQNARHDATINELNILYKQKVHPLRLKGVNPQVLDAFNAIMKSQRSQSLAPTILLINALVPHQDCNKVVAIATNPSAPGAPNS